MDCDSYRRNYLDHDWTRKSLSDAAIIAEHLSVCAECRSAAEDYDHLRSVFALGDVLNDPRLSRPSCQKPEGRYVSTWFAVAAALAPTLAAGLVGWLIYVQSQQQGRGRAPEGFMAARDSAQSSAAPSSAAPSSAAQSPTAKFVPQAGGSAAVYVWKPEEVERGMQVFQEVSATFDGRTSWVALGDRSADMGLESNGVDSAGFDTSRSDGAAIKFAKDTNGTEHGSSFAPGVTKKPRVFLLRLLLCRGAVEISRTDLVIVAGRNARLELPLEPGRILHYVIGTTDGDPPKLSLWTEVRSPHGGETVAVLATQMSPRSGEAVDAGRIVTSSGEYNLEISFVEETLPRAMPQDATPTKGAPHGANVKS